MRWAPVLPILALMAAWYTRRACLTSTSTPSFYGNPPCYRGERGSKIINGYQVVVINVIKEQLCAPRARGLIVVISEFGAQPAISVNSLFGHHLRLLGPNPANWTSKPIG